MMKQLENLKLTLIGMEMALLFLPRPFLWCCNEEQHAAQENDPDQGSFRKKIKQVTLGHNIVVGRWAGASNPYPQRQSLL